MLLSVDAAIGSCSQCMLLVPIDTALSWRIGQSDTNFIDSYDGMLLAYFGLRFMFVNRNAFVSDYYWSWHYYALY